MIKIKNISHLLKFKGINFLDYLNIRAYFNKEDWEGHSFEITEQVICENLVKEK